MIYWLLLLGFVFMLLTVIIVRSCVESSPERKDNAGLADRPRLNREELLQLRRDELQRNLGETPKEE